jgi:hypothetical protein
MVIPPLPARVDSHFQRIADRLSVFELMAARDEDDLDAGMRPGEREETRFLNFYSKDGIRLAMDAYGFEERFRELGLVPNEIVITREDAFHHRMQLVLGGVVDEEHRVMDIRVHLRHIAAPGDEEEGKGPATFGVMVIEWLLMQNPRAEFTRARPPLPGQDHPGTGLGRAIHNVLMLIGHRLRRDAIVNVPEHFHLAWLYLQMGYRYPSLRARRELEAVVEAVDGLHFAVAAWAVERGFVRIRDKDGERAWRYQPMEMILPLSSEMRSRLPGITEWVTDRLFESFDAELFLDREGLRQSLQDDPVPLIDADELDD